MEEKIIFVVSVNMNKRSHAFFVQIVLLLTMYYDFFIDFFFHYMSEMTLGCLFYSILFYHIL